MLNLFCRSRIGVCNLRQTWCLKRLLRSASKQTPNLDFNSTRDFEDKSPYQFVEDVQPLYSGHVYLSNVQRVALSVGVWI